MKLILFILFLACSCSLLLAQQNSTATAVTIFRNGAQVHRVAEINITKGTHEYALKGFSQAMNPKNLQISAPADFSLLSSSNRSTVIDSTFWNNEIKQMMKETESLGRKIDDLQNVFDSYKAEHDLLVHKNNDAQSGLNSVEAMVKLADLYRTRLLEVKRKMSETQYQIDGLKLKHNEQTAKLEELKQKELLKHSNTLYLVIESPKDQLVKFDFDYQINGLASWASIYDIRVGDVHSAMQFISKAEIYQQTGEDWINVNCTLSTGNPGSNYTLNPLTPWWLINYSVRKNSANSMYLDGIRIKAQKNEELEQSNYRTATADVEESLTTNEFTLQEKISIPGNNQSQVVTLNKQDKEVSFKYIAIPKRNKHAFLMAYLSDWENLNLSTGTASIYYKNTLVGQSLIDPSSTDDTLSISLGPDQAVVCERTKLKNEAHKEFFSSKVKSTIEWNLIMKNNKTKEITVELQDQIPLSSSTDYEVNLGSSSNAKYDSSTGILTWEFNLPASKSAQKSFSYSVLYPKNNKPILE